MTGTGPLLGSQWAPTYENFWIRHWFVLQNFTNYLQTLFMKQGDVVLIANKKTIYIHHNLNDLDVSIYRSLYNLHHWVKPLSNCFCLFTQCLWCPKYLTEKGSSLRGNKNKHSWFIHPDFIYNYIHFFLFQCNSPVIIGFYKAFFVENRISICTEFMDGMYIRRTITFTVYFFIYRH